MHAVQETLIQSFIFSLILWILFTFLTVSFKAQMFNFDEVQFNLFQSFLGCWAFGVT